MCIKKAEKLKHSYCLPIFFLGTLYTEDLCQLQIFPEDDVSLDRKNPALGVSMPVKYLMRPRFSNAVGCQIFKLIKYIFFGVLVVLFVYLMKYFLSLLFVCLFLLASGCFLVGVLKIFF